ncbi:F-box/kelch-repeat protein OR23 [Linum perenne]
MTRFRSTPPGGSSIPPMNYAASLIPGLPNDVSAQILSMLPYSHHSRLKPTCKTWHLFLSSQTLISLRRHLRHLSHLLCIFPQDPSISSPYLFDPRRLGSFACVAIPSLGQIVVAGGGSRHAIFGAAGSRMSSVERYDVGKDEWVALDGLPRYRAGCVGVLAGGDGDEKKFWVMGGYGESRTISGVFPVDEYYKDAVVMEVNKYDTGEWKEVGDMWREGERARLGKVVALEEDDNGSSSSSPAVFMLDNNDIFRYDMSFNRWNKEASIPRKAPRDSSYGFVALDGELQVMTVVNGSDSTETRRTRQQKRAGSLFIQIYSPRKKTWRSLISKAPFQSPLDFNTTVMCSIQI